MTEPTRAVKPGTAAKIVGALLVALPVMATLLGCTGGSAGPDAPFTPTASPVTGDVASWDIDVTPKPESTSIPIEVSRLECAGGSTGEVAGANVTYEERRILIEALVVPLPPGAYTCQGNDVSPYNVQLEQPLGDRELVDAACLGDAKDAYYCLEGAVRWSPPVVD